MVWDRFAPVVLTLALVVGSLGVPAFGQGGETITPADIRLPDLVLEVSSASVAEDADGIVAKITRTSPIVILGLPVRVTSSDPTELRVPAYVTIPTHQASCEFVIEVVNDGDIDGTQSVEISASASWYNAVSARVEVHDDDDAADRTIGGHLYGTLPRGVLTVLSDIVVDEGNKLEIEAGTSLQFDPWLGLLVEGSLHARGKSGQGILFTSSGAFAVPGAWSGIQIMAAPGQDSALEYVDITFAGTGLFVTSQKGVPDVLLAHSVVHDCNLAGVYIRSEPGRPIYPAEAVRILHNEIHDNVGHGIVIESVANGLHPSGNHARIVGNHLHDNADTGILLYANNGPDAYSWFPKKSRVAPEISQNVIAHNRIGIASQAKPSASWMIIAATIVGNVVQGNSEDGLSLLTGGQFLQALVANNTIAANGGAGVAHSSVNCQQFSVRNNIIVSNNRGIEAESAFDPSLFSGCEVRYNDVYDNNGGEWINYPVSYGDPAQVDPNQIASDIHMNVSVDPRFVEPGGWDDDGTPNDPSDDFWVDPDYHLLKTSPCVDAGDSDDQNDGWRDMDGRMRVVGAAVDMGADEQDCFGAQDSAYGDWSLLGAPDCWCYPRQCYGDADGRASGNPRTGLTYVGPSDLNILVKAWLVREPPSGPGIASVDAGICADFARDLRGSSKNGLYRVGPSDLNMLIANWLVKEPPHGPGLAPDCLDR